MNKDDIRKLIREGFEESLKQEGSDGNYMAKQNIGAILKAAEIVNEHIKEDEEQPDWVEDKLSKVAENMRALRDFFEKGEGGKEEEDEELEEGAGRSHTMARGKNKKPANYPWFK
jgi:hypothetical protein